MAFPEGAERRWLVFCVSERPDENAALWQWCSTKLFDPHRDSVTFLYCRTETNVILSKMRVLRSTGEAVPSWMPPAITEALSSVPLVSVDWVQIVSDLAPGDAITTWMAENEHRERPTMLLMSSRGHTGLRRFLEGSVSCYLVEQSQTPCLIVRASCLGEGGPVASETADGRTVGIAIDGTSGGRALIEYARTFLLRPNDRVTVLHSRPAGQKTDDELAAIDNAINALQTVTSAVHVLSGDLQVAPVMELLADDARDGICDWVEKTTPDLLVLGSRGLTGSLRRMALGSVSSYCLTHATSPILVVAASVLSSLTADALLERAAEVAVNASEWVHVTPRPSMDAATEQTQ